MNRKTIRPISELRDTNAISELCHQLDRPIFITKNGYADLVILADETYRREKSELLSQEAEEQFQATDSSVNDENNFGFVRVRTVALPVKVAAVSFNTTKIKEELRLAEKDQVDIVLFPELCLTSQTAGPLLLQKTILSSVEKSLQELAAYSQTMKLFYVIGAPWEAAGEIYN